MGYESKNMNHILDFVQKTNLLQIIGRDNGRHGLRSRETSLLHSIQVLLTPALLSFDPWHCGQQTGFHSAQIAAYADNVAAPIFIGSQGLDVDMIWLLRNVQFWRYHFTMKDEVLSPAFEALEAHERPQWWTEQLSQDTQEFGEHWKGCYAFVDRRDIVEVRDGDSGQSGHTAIQDQLNGEDDPYSAFQNIDLHVSDPANVGPWPNNFERILQSLRAPESTPRTRAQHRDHSSSAARDFRSHAVRFEGDGTDVNEDFRIGGWLNPLPAQHGVPGWQRLTMMKYFVEEDANGQDVIDIDALWAYEGVMLPGGKIVVSVTLSS